MDNFQFNMGGHAEEVTTLRTTVCLSGTSVRRHSQEDDDDDLTKTVRVAAVVSPLALGRHV